MLFISPPFGNYINLPYTIPIRGSFTLNPRPGKWKQIFKTLRFSFKYNGWINKIGLRNPGIDYALQKYKNDIISIAILENKEIDVFLEKIPNNTDLEINISCPNTDHDLVSQNIHKFLNQERKWCIIKLSPLTKIEQIDNFYNDGFRQFHCSNTMPTKQLNTKYQGGLSGPYLIPYTMKLSKKIKEKYPDTIVISGGGVTDIDTYNIYKETSDHVSVSSILFNPIKFNLLYFNYLFQ